jgi:transcriptional regulator with XRE-family HTH domain
MYPFMATFRFTEWLKSQREDRGWSYGVFAEKTGLSRGYLNNLEKDSVKPTVDTLKALAPVLGVDFEWLQAQVDFERIGRERLVKIRKHVPDAFE